LHPEGIYSTSRDDKFRSFLYERLLYHFQFHNEKDLFPDVDHNKRFGINIYAFRDKDIKFLNISNLFMPHTVDQCFLSSSEKNVPGIKTKNNKDWETRGHQHRIIEITREELDLFGKLFESDNSVFDKTKLPEIHSIQTLNVLRKIGEENHSIADLNTPYYFTEMWHETDSRKKNIIKQETGFPNSAREWIVSGPNFFVSNPMYQSARRDYSNKNHYGPIDLRQK